MSAGFQRASVLGRVPPSSKGLQVNFCKNTQCENYGIPDEPGTLAKGRRPKGASEPRYVLTGKDKQIPYLKCTACNRKFPIKSNAAIQEEYRRISGYLEDIRKLSCPNSWCANSKIEVSAGTEYYYVHSSSRGQAKRYKCRARERKYL